MSVTALSIGGESSNQAFAVTNQQTIVMLPTAADARMAKMIPPIPGGGGAHSSIDSSGLGRERARTAQKAQRAACSAPNTSAPRTKGQVNAPAGRSSGQ